MEKFNKNNNKIDDEIDYKIDKYQSIYCDLMEQDKVIVKSELNHKSINVDVVDINKQNSISNNTSSCSSSSIDCEKLLKSNDDKSNDSFDSELFITRSELLADDNTVVDDFKFKQISTIKSQQHQQQEIEKQQIMIKESKSSLSTTTIDKVKRAIENLQPKSPRSTRSTKSSLIINSIDLLKSIKWIQLQSIEQIRKNWYEWNCKQESPCILMDDNGLLFINNDNDNDEKHQSIYYDRYHKLFSSKINGTTFYLGRFNNEYPILVKKISTERKNFEMDSKWITIAKKICSSFNNINNDDDNNDFNNPFIKIFEFFYLPSTAHLFLFMELLPNKSMHYHLRQRRRRSIHLDEVIHWSIQLLNAITFMYNQGIVNRSIRLEHLLFDQRFNVKIFNFRRAISYWLFSTNDYDLGNMNDFKPIVNRIIKKERKCRKNNHLPPECFHNNYDPTSIDLWSFAVIVCTLITNRYPFKMITNHVVKNIEQYWLDFQQKHNKLFITTTNDDDNRKILEQIAKMLTSIFKQDIKKRANIEQIQKCSIFQFQ